MTYLYANRYFSTMTENTHFLLCDNAGVLDQAHKLMIDVISGRNGESALKLVYLFKSNNVININNVLDTFDIEKDIDGFEILTDSNGVKYCIKVLNDYTNRF